MFRDATTLSKLSRTAISLCGLAVSTPVQNRAVTGQLQPNGGWLRVLGQANQIAVSPDLGVP